MGQETTNLPAWIESFRQANIAADRRASPDLIGQLSSGARIDTVICTLLDSDPALRLNASLAARYPAELIGATRLLANITGARRAWIITDASAPGLWIAPLRKPARSERIRLIPVRNDYPQADPTMLLYGLLGRRLRPGLLPTAQNVLLLDGASAFAIGEYFLHGRARRSTPFSFHDHSAARAHYLTLPLGISVQQVLDLLAVTSDNSTLRVSDPLRDMRITPDYKVDFHELTLHRVSPPEALINPSPCIRCGWCVEGCPTRIQPAALLEASQRRNVNLARQHGIHACIECGICSYVCPSQLPLLPSIRDMKETMVS